MNEQIIKSFHHKLQPFVKEVLINGRIGICAGNITIVEVQSGSPIAECGYADRCKLIIPFAGQTISWEIIFNSLVPHFPPDFCFDDETFLIDPDIDMIEEHVPSLANWNSQDPQALLQVIFELLTLYKKHQIQQLDGLDYSRLHFEYSCLVNETQVSEQDVEILIGSRNNNINKSRQLGGAVNFLIRLNVDFTGLPPVRGVENPGEDAAVLLVTFHPPEGSRITPQLYFSPRVEKALGGSSSMHLPTFPPGSCLMDYVPIVADQINTRVLSAIVSHDKKKEYLAALLYHMGKALLEYDTITFSRASFLLERRDFHFILHVSLPVYFPRDRPTFLLQSVYHASFGKPFKTLYDDCPYSPRWGVSEMVQRACAYIKINIDDFQQSSVHSCHI